MTVYRYLIVLRYAGARISVKTTATSYEAAKRQVLDFEGAPESAILFWENQGAVA